MSHIRNHPIDTHLQDDPVAVYINAAGRLWLMPHCSIVCKISLVPDEVGLKLCVHEVNQLHHVVGLCAKHCTLNNY